MSASASPYRADSGSLSKEPPGRIRVRGGGRRGGSLRAGLLVGLVGLVLMPSGLRAQGSRDTESALPPDSGVPSASNYYEARITRDGYALYIPFFVSPPRAEPEQFRIPELPPRSEGARESRRPLFQGGLTLRTREEIVPGEFIQVYRPAVYALDETGQVRLLQPEETVTLPKVRIILEQVWLGGSGDVSSSAGTERLKDSLTGMRDSEAPDDDPTSGSIGVNSP